MVASGTFTVQLNFGRLNEIMTRASAHTPLHVETVCQGVPPNAQYNLKIVFSLIQVALLSI